MSADIVPIERHMRFRRKASMFEGEEWRDHAFDFDSEEPQLSPEECLAHLAEPPSRAFDWSHFFQFGLPIAAVPLALAATLIVIF